MARKEIFIIVALLLLSFVLAIENQDLKIVDSEDNQVNIISSVKGSNDVITIEEIKRTKTGLEISYSFDNSFYIGEEISVNVWIDDANSTEISKISDSFKINRDPPIKRKVFLNLSKEHFGIYSIIFEVDNDKESQLKTSIELASINEEKKITTRITGRTILEHNGPKMISFGIFLAIIIVAIFLMMRSHDKNIDNKGHDFVIKDEGNTLTSSENKEAKVDNPNKT